MRKLLTIAFLLISLASFAQDPIYGDQDFRGNISMSGTFMVPIMDTTANHPRRAGALTIRPQDTSLVNPPVYAWSGAPGNKWNVVNGASASTYTSNNGITLTGQNFQLTGALVKNTLVTPGNFWWSMGTDASLNKQAGKNFILDTSLVSAGVTRPNGFMGWNVSPLTINPSHAWILRNRNVVTYDNSGFKTFDTTGGQNLSLNNTGMFLYQADNYYSSITPGYIDHAYFKTNINGAQLPQYTNTDTTRFMQFDASGNIIQRNFRISTSIPQSQVIGLVDSLNARYTILQSFQHFVDLNGSYTNPSWLVSLPWSKITGTPTTLSGYGITDGVPSSRTLTFTGTSPVVLSITSPQDLSTNRSWNISIPLASNTASGYLSNTDWITFNSKSPATGGSGYIQNTTSQQASSNFNISGNGTIGGRFFTNTTSSLGYLSQSGGNTWESGAATDGSYQINLSGIRNALTIVGDTAKANTSFRPLIVKSNSTDNLDLYGRTQPDSLSQISFFGPSGTVQNATLAASNSSLTIKHLTGSTIVGNSSSTVLTIDNSSSSFKVSTKSNFNDTIRATNGINIPIIYSESPTALYSTNGNGFLEMAAHSGTNSRFGARMYIQENTGMVRWAMAPSTAAGTALTYVDRMELNNSGNLSINTTSGGSTLTVNGGISFPFRTITANRTLDNTDYTIRATTSGITITLPTASTCTGRIYVISNYNSGGPITISSYLNNGSASTSLGNNLKIWVQSDGANWYQIN